MGYPQEYPLVSLETEFYITEPKLVLVWQDNQTQTGSVQTQTRKLLRKCHCQALSVSHGGQGGVGIVERVGSDS